MILKLENAAHAAHLFENFRDTMILSCIQGVMGYVYVNKAENLSSAMAYLGDFCFLSGNPDEELVMFKPDECKKDFVIMVPENDEWSEMIERVRGKNAVKITRYALKKEPGVFDAEKLRRAARHLPCGFELRRIDRAIYEKCQNEKWCSDWVAQYEDYSFYEKWGMGVAIIKDGSIISGASSYSSYKGGIEIQIDTKSEYRRRGLAYICAAELILHCLEKGIYPSWDAQNKASLALAQKLGYHFDREYTAYEINGY